MALINFGPGTADDSAYNQLLLQYLEKRKLEKSRAPKDIPMQGGSKAEGALKLVDSGLKGYLEGSTERAQVRAAMEEQQAAINSATANMNGLPSSLGGGGSGGTAPSSGGGAPSFSRSATPSASAAPSTGRQAVADAIMAAPQPPAPAFAAGGLGNTFTLPEEAQPAPVVIADAPPVTDQTFGNPTAILQPGGPAQPPINENTAKEMPRDLAQPSGRDSIVAAMMPQLDPLPQADIPDGRGNPNLPAGMRVNNPGNIKYFDGASRRFAGVVGPSEHTDQGDPQIVFNSPAEGMKAMSALIDRKYNAGKNTVNALIAEQNGWTPGNYAAAANVARSMGVKPDAPIDMADPEQKFRFMRGLAAQEHGKAASLYPDELFRSAINGDASSGGSVRTAQASLPSNASSGRQAVADAIVGQRNPAPAPVQMAQAGAPTLSNGPAMADLLPGYDQALARIQTNLKSNNLAVRTQALKDADSLSKKYGEAQKQYLEDRSKRDLSAYDQGNQNYRQDKTDARLRGEHQDNLALNTRKQDFEEGKGVVVDGQIVNPSTGEVIRGRDQSRALVTPEDRARWGIQKDDKRPYTVGPDGKLQVTAGDPKTTINNVSNPIAKGFADQYTEQRGAARDARNTILGLHEARSALDAGGVVTGFGAEKRLDLSRAGALLGITDGSKVVNTETFRAAIGDSVVKRVKALGANPTDTDLKYIEAVSGGKIELNEQSIRNILDAQERIARRYIDAHNEETKRLGANDEIAPIRDSLMISQPPSYEEYRKSLPQPAPAPSFTREEIEAEIARRKGGRM